MSSAAFCVRQSYQIFLKKQPALQGDKESWLPQHQHMGVGDKWWIGYFRKRRKKEHTWIIKWVLQL